MSFRREFGELVARMYETSDAMTRREAEGWMVVCVDEEPPESLVMAFGPFDSPEQALVFAGEQDRQAKEAQDGDEYGWRHDVIPLFPKEDREQES